MKVNAEYQVGAASDVLCANSRSIQCSSSKSNMGHLEASAAAAGLASLTLGSLDVSTVAANSQLARSLCRFWLFCFIAFSG